MKFKIFPMPEVATEAEFQRDLLTLPLWRQRKAMEYRRLTDRAQSAKAFILLRECIAEKYGRRDLPPFEYGKNGKPFLPGIHFNMSHCRRGVMCAVDDEPVGCDIEAIPDCVDKDLLGACFSEEEQSAIMAASRPQTAFMRLWTAKEALLKLTGTGLTDGLPLLLQSQTARSARLHTMADEAHGYVYTTAQYKHLF